MTEEDKPQEKRKTELTRQLENLLWQKSPRDDWKFECFEVKCACPMCSDDLVVVIRWKQPHFPETCHKSWYTEEIKRRRSLEEFAQSVMDQLVIVVKEHCGEDYSDDT